MLWLDSLSGPVMAASRAAVTSAQATAAPSLFSIRRSNSSRTSAVRPHIPAAAVSSLSVTVTATLAIVIPPL